MKHLISKPYFNYKSICSKGTITLTEKKKQSLFFLQKNRLFIKKITRENKIYYKKNYNRQRPHRFKFKLVRYPDDPFYHSIWLGKIQNKFIKNGKKNLAEKIFTKGLSGLSELTKINSFSIIYDALRIWKPSFQNLRKKRGRREIYIPTKMRELSKGKRALQWLFEAIRLKKNEKIYKLFALEFIDTVFLSTGNVLFSKIKTQQCSFTNRMYHSFKKKWKLKK